MQAVLDHLRENYRIYAGAILISLPALVYFRRWTIPGIAYLFEFLIYSSLMHFVLHGIVVLAAWFREQSTMKRAFNQVNQVLNPGWTTPLTDFWDKDLYTPQWLFWFECAALAAIAALMWRYRPLRVKKTIKSPMTRRTISRKVAAQAMKPHPSLFRRK